ncbi:MAG: hypothetical protein KatS3mg105_2258 [Gemmatales bacterium]|nr:MAG: hypothetical protein KatS3mg105_2258 [Gemmatales bacterium]
MEYQIAENTRRCAATNRELQPGEAIFSVLIDQDGKLTRLDYSRQAWQGPPEGAFAFWASRVPDNQDKRRLAFDDDLLIECFQRLAGETAPDRVNFRYIVALLLLRRKRFKFEGTRLEEGKEWLLLRCTKTRTQYEVENPRLTEQEMAEVQDEVFKVLGWN